MNPPHLEVSPVHEGSRLDRFLTDKLKVSRKKVKRWIDEGKVFLGSKKIIIASWELKSGDRITVQEGQGGPLPRRKRYLKVYLEDGDVLVVEKPPGVACECTPQTLSSTLVDDINDYLLRVHPDKPYPYVGLMHRLDRETSGLMVYTLSKRANRLSAQFRRHGVGRRYWALLEGALSRARGKIDLALRKDPKSGGRKMQVYRSRGTNPAGRAITEYSVLERFSNATLVEARLLTGKTHQVRVHFASLGHPVLGDRLYGSKSKAPRQLLHACYLEFQHPVSGKKLKFHSNPPGDFQKVLENFRRRV